jgi:hypothetical protein
MSMLRAGALSLLLGFAGCAPLPMSFARGPGVQSIDHGQMFGVSIGMDRAAARVALLKNPGSHFTRSEKCRDYPASHEMCDGATETDHFRMDGIFDKGLVDLYVRDDHIVRMNWAKIGYELM